MNLSQVKKGEKVKIQNINLHIKQVVRLSHLGLIKGEMVEVVRFAPLGDPIEIKIKDVYLAIRKSDADKIQVVY